jgi:AraC-like DNA-binding protein
MANMRFAMSDTDLARAYQQLRQPHPVPQALQLEHRGGLYRWVLQHANIGNYKAEKRGRWRISGHSHQDSYHLLLYTVGDTEVVLEGRAQPVRPGTLVLSPPGDVHDFKPVRPGATSYVQITFAFIDSHGAPLALAFNELLSAWSGLELPDRGVVLECDGRQREELAALISRAFEAAQSRGATAQLDLRLEVAALFAWLLREIYLPGAAANAPGSAGSGLAAARAHLEAHYRRKVAVAELAKIAFLSEGYFLRAFKRAWGISPIAYQSQLRLEAARGMLRFSSLSCKEIAARLGYSDGYHFSKSFKKLEGRSPNAYRRRAEPV